MVQFTPAQWSQLLDYLQKKHTTICRQWFHDDLMPGRLDGGVLEIHTAKPVQRDYLENRCKEPFVDAAQQVTGQLVAARFVCERDDVAEPALPEGGDSASTPGSNDTRHPAGPGYAPPPVPDALSRPPRTGRSAAAAFGSDAHASADVAELFDGESMVLSPDHTFENFVPGPENQLAHAAALAVAEEPGVAYNPLFVHGGVGLGKTHLLQAIGQAILDVRPDTRILYVSCDDFITQFIACVQRGKMAAFRDRYRNIDLMMIDDVHLLTTRDRTQEEFHHTFNALKQQGRQIVLSSDAPPHEIPNLEARLVSRLGSGLVAQVSPPGYETRVAILEAKAKMRGFVVPPEVIAYLANRLDNNARELEGAICTLHGHVVLMNQPLTLELTRSIYQDAAPPRPKMNRATLDHIVDAVTGYYNVKFSDLQSRKRPKSITEPRQICMWLARQRTGFSLEEIGGYFGGRDHTTVMHSLNVVENRKSTEEQYARQVDTLLAEIDGRVAV